MKVVLVHGRSQQGKDPNAIQKEWEDALTYGLARGDAHIPAGVSFDLPYYGDELVRLVAEVERGLPADVATRGPDTPDQGLGQTQREVLQEITSAAGISLDEVAREAGSVKTRDPQNWGWVLATLRVLNKIPGLDARAIEAFTKDVAVYITYPAVQRAIDRIVLEAISGDEPFVLIAHSLGTVVAYNTLRNYPRTSQCKGFITVGSPLGIRAISRRLRTPLKWPPGVPSWFNAFDSADVVSLYPLDAEHFDLDPSIENYGQVKNFTDNRHGIAGYLSDPSVAQQIARAVDRFSKAT